MNIIIQISIITRGSFFKKPPEIRVVHASELSSISLLPLVIPLASTCVLTSVSVLPLVFALCSICALASYFLLLQLLLILVIGVPWNVCCICVELYAWHWSSPQIKGTLMALGMRWARWYELGYLVVLQFQITSYFSGYQIYKSVSLGHFRFGFDQYARKPHAF